jgi:hypothetical protein
LASLVSISSVVAACGLACVPSAWGQGASGPMLGLGAGGQADGAGQGLGASALARGALASLETAHPGVGVTWYQGRVSAIYGVPMAFADTPDAAANQWLAAFGASLGAGEFKPGKGDAGGLELALIRAHDVSFGRFVVYVYQQLVGGVPVEHGQVRVLVRRDVPDALGVNRNAVVLVTAKVAGMGDAAGVVATGDAASDGPGLNPVVLTGAEALERAKASRVLRSLTKWSEPELVVYFGEGDMDPWIAPRRAWAMQGEIPEIERRRNVRVFVDAETGTLLHVRSLILHADVAATVNAFATPGLRADVAANPPVLTTLPGALVNAAAGGAGGAGVSGFTNASGIATLLGLPDAGTTLDVSLTQGEWTRVEDTVTGVSILSTSAATSGSSPVTLTLNSAPTQFTTAQVNAFLHSTITRNFIKGRAPAFPGLDAPLPARVNLITASNINFCNAFYDGVSTNYFQAGGGCNNTAFSTVVAHEYGHHVVRELGLAQGAFGEGFADSVAIMIYDTGQIGQDFTTTGGLIRNPESANRQYPCTSSAIHTCGQILGGTIREIRRNLNQVYSSGVALDVARQLFVDWAQIASGGQGLNAAHPTTAIELLTVDDDNAILADGTPHFCQIAAALSEHGIESPSLALRVAFAYPDGVPAFLPPNAETPVRVVVSSNGATPTPNTGRVFFRVGGVGSFQQRAMIQVAPNTYDALIPTGACGTGTEFYFQVSSSAGTIVSPNVGCAAAPVVASSGFVAIAGADDFEADRGWTVGETTATTGAWVRVDPLGTAAQPGDDTTPAPGVAAWVTGNGTNASNPGEADIDNGITTLVSPAYDVAGAFDARVTYNRWFSNNSGQAPNLDIFRVEVSTNNGATWTPAETVGPTTQNSGGWLPAEWTLQGLGLTPTSQVRVRFIAQDIDAGSLVEAAIDDFAIVRVDCVVPEPCVADFDQDGGVTGADIEAFFAAFEIGAANADIDEDGGITGGDVEAFFLRFESGC